MTEVPEESAAEPDPLPPSNHSSRELSKGERVLAAFFGSVGTIAGGVGIFLSENQAGTAVILLMGIIFLIMAVQGTAILRISKDGGDFAGRAPERDVVNRVLTTLEDQGPQAARAALSAATAARPSLEQSPGVAVISANLFEQEALEAARIAWKTTLLHRNTGKMTMTTLDLSPDIGIDAVLTTSGDDELRIAVEVLYSRRPIDQNRLRSRLHRLDNYKIPYLIISSSRLSASAYEAWKNSPRGIVRQFAYWPMIGDTEAIELAIERLVGQIKGELPMDAD